MKPIPTATTLFLMLGLLTTLSCTGPNDVSRIRKGKPTSDEEGFTIRRMFREIFSQETFQNAAHGIFTDELGPPPSKRELRSEKVRRELRAEFGPANGMALECLMLHDYSNARIYAQEALQLNNPKQQRDAAWILALTAAETMPPEKMSGYYALIVKEDRRISTVDEARQALIGAREKLRALRDYFSRA